MLDGAPTTATRRIGQAYAWLSGSCQAATDRRPVVNDNIAVGGFEKVVEAFVGRDDVMLGAGRGFGGNTLQVGGRIFAMPTQAGLALKLPATRVAELVASGAGLAFDAGKGRPMKEWVVIPHGSHDLWMRLAEEALAFVGSRK
jgi:hypothetical protein